MFIATHDILPDLIEGLPLKITSEPMPLGGHDNIEVPGGKLSTGRLECLNNVLNYDFAPRRGDLSR